MSKILTRTFFNRPTPVVAKELLGKFLVCKRNGRKTALMINEVEVYDGFKDKASHAHKGRTKRNNVMFGEGGFWYIYFVYGMYWMLNIVTGAANYPAAILIRGAGEFNGPGKLTKALGIDKKFNEKLADMKTGLWIEDRNSLKAASGALKLRIKQTPRIGVAYAGTVWANKRWRFILGKS